MKFKAGDRVRPVGNPEATEERYGLRKPMIGLIGKEMEVKEDSYDEGVEVWNPGKNKYWAWAEEDLEPVAKTTYKSLKPITIQALEESYACERELHKFVYLLFSDGFGVAVRNWSRNDEIHIEVAVACALRCNGGLRFLIDKGFIVEDKPELELVVGGVYEYIPAKRLYVLCSLPPGSYSLINIGFSRGWSNVAPTMLGAFGSAEDDFRLLPGRLEYVSPRKT